MTSNIEKWGNEGSLIALDAVLDSSSTGADANIKFAVINQTGGIVVTPASLATTTAGEQSDLSLAVLKINGADVIFATWEDWNGGASGAGDASVRARFLNLDGSASSINASDFVVNSIDSDLQVNARVAANPNGGGVIVWSDYGAADIKMKIISSDGTLGAELTVSADGRIEDHPSVTYLADGSFVVSWAINNATPPAVDTDIVAQRFSAAGIPTGALIDVNTVTSGNQRDVSVTALKDGGFLITWTDPSGADGDGEAVKARVYDSGGAVLGGEFSANATIAGNQYAPHAFTLADGRVALFYATGNYDDALMQIVDARDSVISGTTGNDTIYGRDTGSARINDNINGGLGNDVLYGLAGDDRLDGGGGVDSLFGGAGDDTLVFRNVVSGAVVSMDGGANGTPSRHCRFF